MLIWPLLVTASVAVWAWLSGGPWMLEDVMLLAVFEVSMSFDNAVVNAGVLRRMSEFWQRVFLTAGIAVAVFGMRFVLPLICVSVTTGIPPQQAIGLSLSDPAVYTRIIDAATPALFPFGAAYLLMIFLTFIFEVHELSWLRPIEKALARMGRIDDLAVVVTLLAIALMASWEPGHRMTVLISGLAGLLTYLIVNGFAQLLLGPSGQGGPAARGRSAFFLFLYLEILDASFSLDGVIGAFAISSSLLVIAAGLGVGAVFVRTLTIQLVRRGVMSEYVYLEHGAHWAIGALAVNMLIKLRYPVDGGVTGLIGVAFIGASFLSSAWAQRYVPAHARRRGRGLRKPPLPVDLPIQIPAQQRRTMSMDQADGRFMLFDVDGNGYLEQNDYESLAHRLAEGFGVPMSSPRGQAVLDGSLALWHELLRCTDADGDQRISLEEFRFAVRAGALRDREGLDAAIVPAARAVLDLCDADSDGELDRDDLTRLLTLCGLPAGQAGEIFTELDADGSGSLSLSELTGALHRLLILDPSPA